MQKLHINTTEVVEMMTVQEIPNMGKDIQPKYEGKTVAKLESSLF